MVHALAQVLRAPNAVELLMAARPNILQLSEDAESEATGFGMVGLPACRLRVRTACASACVNCFSRLVSVNNKCLHGSWVVLVSVNSSFP